MIIKNFSLKNKYVDYKDETVDFHNYGIYVVSGANGSGKSTIIKEIVFGSQPIVFNTAEQNEAFIKDRSRLFSYVAQNNDGINLSAAEYIRKGNKNVSASKIKECLRQFGVDYLELKTAVKDLSGGERNILAIISAFVKDTPYLFFDEPTNNLDDNAVRVFSELVRQQRDNKTIVIVSHDKRLVFQDANEVAVSHDGISETLNGPEKLNIRKPAPPMETRFWKIALRIQHNTITVLAAALVFLLFLGLFFFDAYEFVRNYSTDPVPGENAILVYQAEYVYPNLNEAYADQEGLAIDRANYNSLMQLNDIATANAAEGVTDIYIADEKYYDHLASVLQGNETAASWNEKTVSLPDIVYKNFLDQIGLQDLFVLQKGAHPADNKSEMVISVNIARELFGIENSEDIIGQTVVYDDMSYEIVGIAANDIIWRSYRSEINDLFYRYSRNSGAQFIQDCFEYQQEKGRLYPEAVNNIVIITQPGCERKVLNTLMSEFPADNFYSNYYCIQWDRSHNRTIMNRLYLINLVLIGVTCILLYLVQKNSRHDELSVLKNYAEYYILKNRLIIIFIVTKAVLYSAILAAAGWLVCLLYSQIEYRELFTLLMVDSIILIMFEIVSSSLMAMRIQK